MMLSSQRVKADAARSATPCEKLQVGAPLVSRSMHDRADFHGPAQMLGPPAPPIISILK